MKLPLIPALSLALLSPLVSAQESKLLASDGSAYDRFGESVAFSGTTVIVGAKSDDDNGVDSGSAYLFDTASETQIAKLLASDGAGNDNFGCSVAISGTTAIIGASRGDGNGADSGSAYLFDTTTGTQIAKLTASDGAGGSNFGYSVAISGTLAIVGASLDDSNGSAYIFDISNPNTPLEIAKLGASDGTGGAEFGWSVAISGTTAIVGAPFASPSDLFSGSAYLFDISNPSAPTEIAMLEGDGGWADQFGWSVAVNGTTAIVGAVQGSLGGSAYLFDTTTGTQTAQLIASDDHFDDYFGVSVAISDTTVIVGAYSGDGNVTDSGSAYIFDISDPNLPTEEFKLQASDGTNSDFFGYSVAISGNAAIIGAVGDNANGDWSGSAYLLDISVPTPIEEIKLLAGDGHDDDWFGASVAIRGNTAIVGAPADDNGFAATNSGSAYLFDTTNGTQLAKLTAWEGLANHNFGWSVAITEDIALAGAPAGPGIGQLNDSTGCVYLFDTTTSSTNTPIAKLLASDGVNGDDFGYSVAVSGDKVIVGAYRGGGQQVGDGFGCAYLFDISNPSAPIQLAKFTANDGATGAEFGSSVAVSGDTAIVGAPFDKDNGDYSGSAYLFNTATGAQIAKLLPSDGASYERFGHSVAINGNTTIVGAFGAGSNGDGSGSAYLFDTITGAELAKLLPSNGTPYDEFGVAVNISGNTAIVGAPRSNHNSVETGSTYLFDISNPIVPIEFEILHASDGVEYDYFGYSVALSGGTVIVGEPLDTMQATPGPGSAYLYDVGLNPGTSFCFGDGTGTACPCGNLGSAGEGCANDTGSGGLLSASGSNSVLADDLVLEASGLTSGPGLYFQGNNAVNGGLGNPFGDGLRCAGNEVIRLEVQFSSFGTSATSISIASRGGVSVGDTKRYQLWYRDTGGSPCNSGFNLTNGYEITWTP